MVETPSASLHPTIFLKAMEIRGLLGLMLGLFEENRDILLFRMILTTTAYQYIQHVPKPTLHTTVHVASYHTSVANLPYVLSVIMPKVFHFICMPSHAYTLVHAERNGYELFSVIPGGGRRELCDDCTIYCCRRREPCRDPGADRASGSSGYHSV